MSAKHSQLLARAGAVRRIDALFRAMETDFLLREQFITDPTQILTEYMGGGARVSLEQSVVTNRLIYSVFANKRLLRWFQEYAHRHMDNVPTTEQFLSDFCDATVGHDGRSVVAALAAGCAAGTGIHGLSEHLLHYFINLHTAQMLRQDTDDEGPAAEAEAEDEAHHDRIEVIGEEASSTLTAVTWTTYTTGTGTGTGTGVATRSPFTALRIREQEDAEERVMGPFVPLYAAVTLNALALYAAQLEARGALQHG